MAYGLRQMYSPNNLIISTISTHLTTEHVIAIHLALMPATRLLSMRILSSQALTSVMINSDLPTHSLSSTRSLTNYPDSIIQVPIRIHSSIDVDPGPLIIRLLGPLHLTRSLGHPLDLHP
jgi:hypothetical protein